MLSDAYVRVSCDQCHDPEMEEEIPLTATVHGWDERSVDDDLKERGWKVTDDDKHLCPNCAEQEEAYHA